MTILIIIIFLQREYNLFSYWSLENKTYKINKSTHGVSLLMVSYQASNALIFQFFDVYEAVQHSNIIVHLPHYDIYSMYRGCITLFALDEGRGMDDGASVNSKRDRTGCTGLVRCHLPMIWSRSPRPTQIMWRLQQRLLQIPCPWL